MKRIAFGKIASMVLALLFAMTLFSACGKTPSDSVTESGEDCIDGVCTIPEEDENGRQVYAIVSPQGYSAVEPIRQAPRVDSLDGKTIAIVGGSFMASVTHPELKKIIQTEFPTAKVYLLNEVGTGGPYSVLSPSEKTIAFQNKLKALGVDLLISGNCGCGLCTTKETGSSIAAEYIGIPTVTIGGPAFIAQIHSTGVNRGVSVLRTAEYPGSFSQSGTDELLKNVREVVWPQILKGFTQEITEDEIAFYANDGKRPFDEVVYYGSYEDIQDFCAYNDWTDGLPIVPATDEKVREYLKYCTYEASDVLGTFALAYRECTAYTVAVNAVMSGVPKEFMPICMAFVNCMNDGEWRRPLASTHGWSPYAWLNGPLARQLGIDSAQGMISEENNKALGRFIDLCMLNIGGYYVKENRMSTFGYLTPWTFAEDDAACVSVGWKPYHVTQGYALNDNTITAASALSWGNSVTPATENPEQIMNLMAWDITEKQQNGLGTTNPQVYRTLFVTSCVAENLVKTYQSKSALEDTLILTARRPLYMRAYANYWGNTGSQQYKNYTFDQYYEKLKNDPQEMAALTKTPEWLAGITDDASIYTIQTMNKGETPILVTGDASRNKFQVMPGGGYKTVEIKLPENWNELVAPLGYEPIELYYLSEIEKPGTELPPISEPESDVDALDVSDILSDGTYRLLPSESQLSDGSKLFYNGETLSFWDGASVSNHLVTGSFKDLMDGLNFGTSLTVKQGKVVSLNLRFSSVQKKSALDFSGLSVVDLSHTDVTISVNVKKSADGGGVSQSNTSLILPETLHEFRLDLNGVLILSESGTDGFVRISEDRVLIDSSLPNGSSKKVGVMTGDSRYRTVTFAKNGGILTATYLESDSLN